MHACISEIQRPENQVPRLPGFGPSVHYADNDNFDELELDAEDYSVYYSREHQPRWKWRIIQCLHLSYQPRRHIHHNHFNSYSTTRPSSTSSPRTFKNIKSSRILEKTETVVTLTEIFRYAEFLDHGPISCTYALSVLILVEFIPKT